MLATRRAMRKAAPIVAARAPLLPPHAPISSLGRLHHSMLTALTWLQIHVARFSTASSMATAAAPTKRPIDLTSSDFVTIRAKGKAYVDKTSAIVDVLADDALSRRAYFSRPRRFGKSLTIEVMAEMLAAGTLPAGVKEWPGYEPVDVEGLFGGLAVHDRVKAKDPLACSVMERPHFVITLPLGGAQTGAVVKQTIIECVADIAGTAFGSELKKKVITRGTPASAVEALVCAVPEQVPIAVLVDEYDSAIISDVARKRWGAGKEGIAALRSLMMASKAQGLDERIQRFIVTGVARFARTLAVGGVNNFTDLSGHPIASRMLGFTEDEIRTVFPSELEALGRHVAGRVRGAALTAEEARDEAMKQLACWHNDYCFDGTNSCYYPTPVLTALAAQRVASKAMEGSTAHGWLGVRPAALLAHSASREEQTAAKYVDIADLEAQTVNPTALLLQTGLLTLKPLTRSHAAAALPATQPTAAGGADGPSAAAAEDDDPVVTLQAPNEYARKSLLQLVAYATDRNVTWLSEAVERVRAALATRDHAVFGKILVELLTGIPHPMTSMKAGVTAGDAQAPARGATGDASAPPLPCEAPYHAAVYGFLRAAVPHQLSSLLVEQQSQFGAADIVLHLKPLGTHPEEVWVLEVGAATPKLRQIEAYDAHHAAQPGKIAAVVVDRDAKEVVVAWRQWDVAGRVWKDLPEQ